MPIGYIAGAVVAPAIGSLIKGATGTGKDTTMTTSFGDSSQYDPNAQYYGGDKDYLRNQSANLNYREGLADTRGANTADFNNLQPNYADAAAHGTQANAAREAQGNAANLMYQRATGAVPSIAGQQSHADIAQMQANAQQQAQAAQAAQMSAGASARGGAGLALAQQGAANNIANAQGGIGRSTAMATQGISNQAQVNAAQERLNAEQGAFGAFSGMRQGDMSAADAATQRAQYGSDLATQQRIFNAQQEQANRNANDTRAMGYENLNQQMQTSAMNSRNQNNAMLSGGFMQQQGLHADRGARNAGEENANWKAAGSGMSSMGGSGGSVPAGTEALAKGGPAAAGHPYLVGEKGPELIVPRTNGYVLPNNAVQQLSAAQRGPTPGAAGNPDVQRMYADWARNDRAPLAPQSVALSRGGVTRTQNPSRPTQQMLDDRYQEQQARGAKADFEKWAQQNAAQPPPDLTPAKPLPAPTMSQADWERKLTGAPKEYNQRDPAVGLERVAQERPMLAKGGARPSNDNAQADEDKGVAPGTTDFESTEPKKKGGPDYRKIAGALGGFFGGRREGGGPIEPGKAYIAGEKGPEEVVSRGSKGEDYGFRTAQASMDKALAEKAQERRDMPKEEHRDTPLERARVKEAYYKGLAQQADDMMAGYKTSLAKGASVSRDEGELGGDAPPWLARYMDGRPEDRGPGYMPAHFAAPMNGDWKLDPAAEASNPMAPYAWEPDALPNYSDRLASHVAAREEGGPIEKGKTYLVGEAGKEAVVSKPKPKPKGPEGAVQFTAVRPEEPQEGVAPSPHPLPAPPPAPTDPATAAPEGPSPLPPPPMSPEQRQMRAAADEARTAADERAAFEQWQAMHPETQTWANRMQEVMSARSQGRKPGEYKVETKPDEAPLALQRGGRKSTGTARSVAMRKRQ